MPILHRPDDLVDSARYRFDDADLIARSHRQFADDGVCILPGFLHEDAVDALVAEADALAPLAHRAHSRSTPYLAAPDESFDESHPRRTVVHSAVEAVAYDLFPVTSLLRRLYEWDALKDFVGAVLGQPVLHRYADPFGALNLAVMREGDLLGWHFDMTDFVVSIALQSSIGGGHFLNAKQLRSAGDEHYDDVAAVLAADAGSPRVRTEPMTPGTLMLFNGRHSMHKVSPIEGSLPRYVALLAYDTKPGTDSTRALKLSRYGRLPATPTGDQGATT